MARGISEIDIARMEMPSGTLGAYPSGNSLVVPFTIACGHCWFCQKELWSLCDNSNPNAKIAEAAMGHSPSGLFGYSHMMGGYAGGQAEYVRVPMADVAPMTSGTPRNVLKIDATVPSALVTTTRSGRPTR